MEITKLHGVCTALVTPFKNQKIDKEMLYRLVERQINNGITALVLAGTTGEAPTLTDEEKQEMIHMVKSYVGKDTLVFAGTGTNSTERSVTLSKDAKEAGADGLLIVSPYYNKGNPDGIYLHYKSIADSVNLPIILYNVPSRTGLDIPLSVYQKLSELPNIIGVKEASSDITKIGRIRNICRDRFAIWTGNDDQIVPVMAMGGIGVISVLSNIYPRETVAMTKAALSGDYQKASAMQCAFMPFIEALFSEVNPIPVKYAMKCIGLDCGETRLPLGKLSDLNRKRIENLL